MNFSKSFTYGYCLNYCRAGNASYFCRRVTSYHVMLFYRSVTIRCFFSKFSPSHRRFVSRVILFQSCHKKFHVNNFQFLKLVKFPLLFPAVILQPFWRSKSPFPARGHSPSLLPVKFTPPRQAVILHPSEGQIPHPSQAVILRPFCWSIHPSPANDHPPHPILAVKFPLQRPAVISIPFAGQNPHSTPIGHPPPHVAVKFFPPRPAAVLQPFWQSNSPPPPAIILHPCWWPASPLPTRRSSSTPPAVGQLHLSPRLLIFHGKRGKEGRGVKKRGDERR